ncbi:MAG: hypothetical protein GF408_03825 [Candidatus Omnitrophica bacterium]|nr:hypothetical protein [Candidatus Omnitrophota bacterium]
MKTTDHRSFFAYFLFMPVSLWVFFLLAGCGSDSDTASASTETGPAVQEILERNEKLFSPGIEASGADGEIYAEAYHQKGLALLDRYRKTGSLKDLYTALNSAGEAVSLAPEDASYWVTLGDLHSEMAKYGLFRADERALRSYEEALKLAPENSYAMVMAGIKLARMGVYDTSLDYFERALSTDPSLVSNNILQWMTLGYIYGHRTLRGTLFYEGLLKEHPEFYFIRVYKALLYAAHFDKPSALRELDSVIGDKAAAPEIRSFASGIKKDLTGEPPGGR